MLKNFTILYVEDDDIVRGNAVEYLSRIAKKVYEAKDGEDAIEIWQKHRPDIIIADISMPKLNGIEMAKYIREYDKDVQIIIATAHSDKEFLLDAVELQLAKYIIKPITKQKLFDALNKSLLLIQDKGKLSVSIDKNFRYNVYEKTLYNNQEKIKLTKNELLFLELLIKSHPRVVSYAEMEDAIWQYDGMSQDAIKSLVRGLRKKLPDGVIENISGIGYKLNIISG